MKKAFLATAAIALAISSQAHAAYIGETEPNNSLGSAQNVNAAFSLDADAFITNSTTVPHASIRGNGSADNDQTFDYFRFTLPVGGVNVLFDIDFGMNDLDSWMNLYTGAGVSISSHDDGGVIDAGTNHGYDGYWNVNLATAGDYIIRVGRFSNLPLGTNQDYVLHISVPNHATASAVPEPASIALLGLGLLGMGLASRKRKAA